MKFNYKLILLAISFFLTLYIFSLNSEFLSIKKYTSNNLDHLLQVKAFKEFKLNISEKHIPFRHDLGLYNGKVQQLWGLGIPLLLLPFELIANLFAELFPEILFFYIFAFLVFNFLVKSLFNISNLWRSIYAKFIFVTSLSLYFALSDPFIFTLSNKFRFAVYEQVVLFNYLYIIFLFSILISSINNNNFSKFCLACFFSGFACLIRPTSVFYSFTFFIAFNLIFYQFSFKNLLKLKINTFNNSRLIPFFLFSLPILFLLITNYLRFGSMLEFGYGLNLSANPYNDIALRVGYPFQKASFFEVSKEMFGSFLPTKSLNIEIGKYPFYKSNVLYGQSEFLRFRSFYYNAYSFHTIFIFVFSLISLPIVFHLKKNLKSLHANLKKIIIFSYSIGFISFLGLFFFYLYSPSISSRYMVDFGPAIYFIIFSFSLLLICTAVKMKNKLKAYSLYFLVIFIFGLSSFNHKRFSFLNSGLSHQNLVKFYKKNYKKFYSSRLENKYSCNGDNLYINGQLRSGWNDRNHCLVNIVSTFIFNEFSCIELSLEIKENKDYLLNSLLDNIKAKIASSYIKNKTILKRDEHLFDISFCLSDFQKKKFKKHNLITLIFGNPHTLSHYGPPIKMLEIIATT